MPLPSTAVHGSGCCRARVAMPETDEVVALAAAPLWIGAGVLVWVASGVVAAYVLGRRGHHLRSLIGLAVVLGPLFVPLAWDFARRREPAAVPINLDPAPRPGTGRHAIVALLGAPESVVDALPVLASYGAFTAITLAAPIDYESADRSASDEGRVAAERRLSAAATFLTDVTPARVLVPGTPETALARLVGPEHDVIVITGATHDVGAERLSAAVGIPVVVAPRQRRQE